MPALGHPDRNRRSSAIGDTALQLGQKWFQLQCSKRFYPPCLLAPIGQQGWQWHCQPCCPMGARRQKLQGCRQRLAELL